MNAAPSLDITHDHWDDVNVLNNVLTPAAALVSPPSNSAAQFLRPGAPSTTGTGSVGVRDVAPVKPSASLLSIVDSQLEESEQCAAPASFALTLTQARY